jgi:hypothetical protein
VEAGVCPTAGTTSAWKVSKRRTKYINRRMDTPVV